MSNTPPPPSIPRISLHQFERIAALVRETSGISLPPGKESLVAGRIGKQLSALKLENLNDYLALVERDPGARSSMLDALSTNTTRFFREPRHFAFLRDRIAAQHGAGPLKIWSAGCSTGQEPYSLSMTLLERTARERTPEHRILATDLSRRAIELAKKAEYSAEQIADVPRDLVPRHFEARGSRYLMRPESRASVTFARLNLLNDWPMRGRFHLILCRNVMIYFERETRARLELRFSEMLEPGGYLFIGHSESLSACPPELSSVEPAVYRRRA